MLIKFIVNLIASAFVMKRNMDWHRRVMVASVPLFIIFMLAQAEYIVFRMRNNEST